MADGFKFDFTLQKFKTIIGNNQHVEDWYEALCRILPDYEIDTVPRVAAFLAQTAHESGGYRAIKENLNYKAESLMRVWPRYFPDMATAQRYAHKQEAIANRAYANRMGNGPEESGDGWKFCGRGLIQLTGKDNYTRYAQSLEISLDEASEHLTTFEGCVQSAAWFWEANNLNQWADSGDILTLTKRINGGTLGLADRQKHYDHAIHVLEGQLIMDQLAWMFGLIPDSVLVFLIHTCLLAGIVLSVLGTFSSKFPFIGEYGRLAKLVGIPLFLFSIFLEGGLYTEMKWRNKASELEAKVQEAEAKSKETNTVIEKVYVDRVKTVKEVQVVIQERIKEVEKKIDAECKVAPEAISILNDAAKLRKGTVEISTTTTGDKK